MAGTPEGRRLTDVHRRQQVILSGEAAAEALLLWRQRESLSDAGWVAAQVALLQRRDTQSAALALTYLRLFRQTEAGTDDMPEAGVDGFDAARVTRSLWSNGPALLRRLADEGVDAAEAHRRAGEQVAATVQRHALAGGRRVVDQSALVNPRSVGWRRVSDGAPCSWCAMLVARGPAFRSEQSAGAGRRYHDHCGCSVEEVFGRWEPTPVEERWVDTYEAVHRPGMSPAQTAAAMRSSGDFADSPLGARPDPTDRAAWQAYWARRQNRIAVDFKGDTLEPHEVEFVERFVARGEQLDWIPKLRSTPTNDFIWVSNGDLPAELKSTQARYATIRGRILDAVYKADRQGVVKENFIIDLGGEALTDDLRDELGGYNEGRQKYRISRLWVMHRDGAGFEEIRLRT